MAAAAWGGTTQKCDSCGRTVYPVEELAADGRVYHRPCFRCTHCKATLQFSNYSSVEGVLYCKPHYDQILKSTGSLEKSFEGTSKSAKAEKSNGNKGQPNRFSSMFVGTQDKCVVCNKTVYPLEKVNLNGSSYHKSCFRCTHGGCTLSPSNNVTHEGKLYCKTHHSQLFMVKGNFSNFEDSTPNAKVDIEKQPEHEDATKNPGGPGQGDGLTEKPLESELTPEKPSQDDIVAEKQSQSSVDVPKQSESSTTVQRSEEGKGLPRVSQIVM
ncbi:hypothetical protein OsJ_20745 [Oryza sativa Japonica Group]|uniref:LIM zinc-binding domain-containing protein n=1 Tax=Oryza sativa subsp. japonica TaxID=39947 RepID=B9FSE7_ORYSJ|nr:hypothetical protein OsJ_20745 [Oryza sativa Japonica Group]